MATLQLNGKNLATQTSSAEPVLASNVTGGAGLDASNIGIKEHDEWRITSDHTTGTSGNHTYFTTNLERVDTTGFNKLGTGLSHSSGVFSFPSTGYWRVAFCVRATDNARFDYCRPFIWLTTDGTNYVAMISGCLGGERASGDPERSTIIEGVFDITSTTNCKVKFSTMNSDPVTINGDSAVSETYFTFTRIGDT